MWVVCHSCARAWEVHDPELWGANDYAACGECGREHTLEECIENRLEFAPYWTRKTTDAQKQAPDGTR